MAERVGFNLRLFADSQSFRRIYPDSTALGSELKKPAYQSLLELVLPHYSDPEQIATLITSTADADLLHQIMQGQCGQTARAVLIQRAEQLLDDAAGDLGNISLACEPIELEGGRRRAGWVSVVGSRSWTSHEALLCQVVQLSLHEERWQKKFLSLLAVTESALRDAAETAARLNAIPFRSVWGETVRCLGVLRLPQIALPALEILADFRHDAWREPTGSCTGLESKLWFLTRNDDRQHFSRLLLLQAVRFSHNIDADGFIELLRSCWNSGVYILRMEAMELARSLARHLSEHHPEKVPQVWSEIESCLSERNPVMNTFVLEALAGYDGYERPVEVEQALTEMRRLIAEEPPLSEHFMIVEEQRPEHDEHRTRVDHAYSIVDKMFEDVYQGAYYDAYEMLNHDEQVRLLYLAGQRVGAGFYTEWILHELNRLHDKRALPVYKLHASKIEAEAHCAQEAARTFFLSIVGYAQFSDRPPEYRGPDDPNHRAWATVGEIIFWDHQRDRQPTLAGQKIRSLWLQLHGDMATAFPDILHKLHGGWVPGESAAHSLIRSYPGEIRSLLEVGIARRNEITSVFFNGASWLMTDTQKFAINALATIGSESSVPILIELQDDPQLGLTAVEAVKKIRSRKPR
jgi:hypothetical protein